VITKLSIKNFAIIEELDVSFDKGLTILTGETGAGKSVVMGALSLLLGQRAEALQFYDPSKKCILEAVFSVEHIQQVHQFLLQNDIDHHPDLILRREFSSAGKSRVFINDTPATLQMLSSLSTALIDLHRQFDSIELQQHTQQLVLVDAVCNHASNLETYKQHFRSWTHLLKKLEEQQRANLKIKQELDYHQFLVEELEQFNPIENELDHLQAEVDVLSNSETIKNAIAQITYQFKESDAPMLARLKNSIQLLSPYIDKHTGLGDISARLQSSYVELMDIGNELERIQHNTYVDDKKLDGLQERIHEGQRLLKKHHVSTDTELMQVLLMLKGKVQAVDDADALEAKLIDDIEKSFLLVEKYGEIISVKRKEKIKYFEDQVQSTLAKIGMPNAQFKIQVSPTSYTEYGKEEIQFLVDTNKTGQFTPLSKTASGGELSRLMLSIKSLVANSNALPTLVFDEIDSGISGETAMQVGNIMKQLSQHHQLICITHLPQIAGKANQHILIYKIENERGQIQTKMKQLTENERIDVLAEMLSGKDASKNAKATIKELMK
jgi:DNA repair protein RecN (Recombination protein N)